MTPSSLTVSENGLGRYQQSIRSGTHRLIADEALSAGGGDAGPAPYDYLLAALGSCTSMTLRMYAERKAIQLSAISVELTHEKIDTESTGKRKKNYFSGRSLYAKRNPGAVFRFIFHSSHCTHYFCHHARGS